MIPIPIFSVDHATTIRVTRKGYELLVNVWLPPSIVDALRAPRVWHWLRSAPLW